MESTQKLFASLLIEDGLYREDDVEQIKSLLLEKNIRQDFINFLFRKAPNCIFSLETFLAFSDILKVLLQESFTCKDYKAIRFLYRYPIVFSLTFLICPF